MEVKVKVWIENENNDLIFGHGKREVLEEIERTGSISKASKNLQMNYKKAWSHIKIIKEFIEDDLVVVKQGRGEDSGTKLTQKAKELIGLYKILNSDIKEYSERRFKELFLDNLSLKIKKD